MDILFIIALTFAMVLVISEKVRVLNNIRIDKNDERFERLHALKSWWDEEDFEEIYGEEYRRLA